MTIELPEIDYKALERAAQKRGYTLKRYFDLAMQEYVYTLLDRKGQEVAQGNDKRYMLMYLEGALAW